MARRLRRSVGIGALVVAVWATASGCVTMPEARIGRTVAWSPVTSERALTFLKRYEQVSNKASETRDPELIAQVESGPLLRATRAEFRIANRLDPDRTSRSTRARYTNQRIYIPDLADYPVWFVAVSDLADEGRTTVSLVVRSNAGSLWHMTQSVALDDDAQLPELVERNGKVVALDTGSNEGLVRSPWQAAQAYANLLMAGPDAPHAAAFHPHPQTARSHQATQRNKEQPGFTYDQKVSVVSVRALAVADGSAFVLFTLEENEELSLQDARLRFDRNDAVAAYTGRAEGDSYLRTSWVWQAVAVVPPKGAPDPRIRLLGVERSLESAKMR
ncbi:hypothetical protein [Thermasporomyces composti]|uniref:DUF8094 domain-containing protein n=1 Tax=Thermasporomyces composti TaxID=696763 RepID=A0A3D9V0T3_THECX|nr:hypothetical protein [Thermasporomyces composti]REF35368.1 hypothetical protein DFJ64_0747 [Thermasporomyces composti]